MRQQTQFDPSIKHFEAYLDFSGGQNSEVSNERLAENEFITLQNIDNSGRGSAKIRKGRVELDSPRKNTALGVPEGALAQGIFTYHRSNGKSTQFVAVHGQLFGMTDAGVCYKIPIVDGANADFRFQEYLPIEAAQYKENVFVATGTKLVEVTATGTNNLTAKVVAPYKPTAMEAIYIGTNGLAPNPDAYIEDTVSVDSKFSIIGVKPASRKAAVNVPLTFTAFIARPSGDATALDYKWEYKTNASTTTTWTLHRDYTANLKTTDIAFPSAAKYDIRVSIRKAGQTAEEANYILSNFEVANTADPPTFPVDQMQTCRKIILHWDRILLSGDSKNPFQMYISDLTNPRFYPVTNTIGFDFGKQEPITAVVRFQDLLVVFTTSMIQTLVGKSTEDYARYLIHDGIGCVNGRTAQVVGNQIMFLSEEGIYALKPNPFRLETMNVYRVDSAVETEIKPVATTADACAMVKDSQYWLCYPRQKKIFRYYFERKVWVTDASDKLDLVQFHRDGDEVYNLTTDGRIYKHDENVTTDAGTVYRATITSKFYDLGASFNNKKLKRLYILAKHFPTHDVKLFVTVKADSSISLTPETGEIVDKGRGLEWSFTSQPNFEFLGGTAFGSWVLGKHPFGDQELSVQRASVIGKCRRVQITVEFDSGSETELYGFAFQYKFKKV